MPGIVRRVRVAIVTDYCFPQLGGISEVVHAQALGLTARGHEVTVVTGHLLRRPEVVDDPRPPHAGAYEIIRTGAAIPLFGNGSATLHTIPPMLTETLRRLFRKRRFDVVHVHAPVQPGDVPDRAARDPVGDDRRRHLPLGVRAGQGAQHVRPADALVAREARRPRRRRPRLRRLARALLPVRLRVHPERRRLRSLPARGSADRRSSAATASP